MAYRSIELPQGAFIGWGSKAGQKIEGKVLDYDEKGGRNQAKPPQPCPQLILELKEKAFSYSTKRKEWTPFEAGTLVTVTCGQWELEKKIRMAEPRRGDMVLIEMIGEVETNDGNTVKKFDGQIDQQNGRSPSGGGSEPNFDSSPSEPAWSDAPLSDYDDSDEPPF